MWIILIKEYSEGGKQNQIAIQHPQINPRLDAHFQSGEMEEHILALPKNFKKF